jgi:hypothetical protein
MKQLEFITLVGGAAASWPLAARGQRVTDVRHVVGVLMGAQDDPFPQTEVDKINMKVAKTVGLTASSSLLVRADEVIEGPRRLLALRDILQRRASSVAKLLSVPFAKI